MSEEKGYSFIEKIIFILPTIFFVFFMGQVWQFGEDRITVSYTFIRRLQHFLMKLEVSILHGNPLAPDFNQDNDEEGGQAEEEGSEKHEEDAGVFFV